MCIRVCACVSVHVRALDNRPLHALIRTSVEQTVLARGWRALAHEEISGNIFKYNLMLQFYLIITSYFLFYSSASYIFSFKSFVSSFGSYFFRLMAPNNWCGMMSNSMTKKAEISLPHVAFEERRSCGTLKSTHTILHMDETG